MSLNKYLSENRDAILQKWILRSLKRDEKSKKFLSRLSFGEFTDPLGYTVKRELEVLFDAILGDLEGTHAALDGILRIQAVQGIKPSEAISFIFDLRDILLNEYKMLKKADDSVMKEWVVFEDKIHELNRQAFDVYMECREQLFNIKLDEYKRNNFAGFDESMSCSSKTVPTIPTVELSVFDDREE